MTGLIVVGNAVPPLLARRIFESVIQTLKETDENFEDQRDIKWSDTCLGSCRIILSGVLFVLER